MPFKTYAYVLNSKIERPLAIKRDPTPRESGVAVGSTGVKHNTYRRKSRTHPGRRYRLAGAVRVDIRRKLNSDAQPKKDSRRPRQVRPREAKPSRGHLAGPAELNRASMVPDGLRARSQGGCPSGCAGLALFDPAHHRHPPGPCAALRTRVEDPNGRRDSTVCGGPREVDRAGNRCTQ